MPSLQARLSKLEAAAAAAPDPDEQLAEAAAACFAGTATFEQMAPFVTDLAEEVFEAFLPYVPELVALRAAGRWMYGPWVLLAYPPGEPLTQGLKELLGAFHFGCTVTPQQVADLRRKGNPWKETLSPGYRLADAAWAIMLGLPDGAKARHRIWRRNSDGEWELRPEVLAAATAAGRQIADPLTERCGEFLGHRLQHIFNQVWKAFVGSPPVLYASLAPQGWQ